MPALICPLCRLTLIREEKTWRCDTGHAFDIAREGYVNLLPVQHKKSLTPGDSADMLQARRAFLAAGHYAPLRTALLDMLQPTAATCLLDIGCGEGWYTSALASADIKAVADHIPGAAPAAREVIGIDIAKAAIQMAAKSFPQITWLVGSSAALPIADASVDLITSLFSPLPAAEMARVLKPGGHLLVATPAPQHLWSLREALFDDVREHRPEKFIDVLAPGFTLIEQRESSFALALDHAGLNNLLQMTPYIRRAKAEKRAALLQQEHFSTTADFRLFLFRRS